MQKILLLLSLGLGLSSFALAEAGAYCFFAQENQQVIISEGDCSLRHAPCSTFKVPLSLMGYNEGLLIDETHPEWPFRPGYPDYLDSWRQPHTPHLWMKNSCVWYSQVLTEKLGIDKFADYVKKFDYGNQDVSGDKGKMNGLTRSWLSSSLEISPKEQVAFLQKLLADELPVSLKSHQMTKKILFVEDLPGGWKLYGKSGSGSLLSPDRTEKLDRQIGWFIGWVQKEQRTIIFAHFIEDDERQDTYAGLRAKVTAKEKLRPLIERRAPV
ncbi:MAG: Class beta-lactamase [Chlamydiales bacterium]|jgi:beta-lactamase class D|nr:Class beta-lactamase [Chlamydiales bacterium]